MISPLLPPDEVSAPGSAAGGGTPAPGPGGGRDAAAGRDEAAAGLGLVAAVGALHLALRFADWEGHRVTVPSPRPIGGALIAVAYAAVVYAFRPGLWPCSWLAAAGFFPTMARTALLVRCRPPP